MCVVNLSAFVFFFLPLCCGVGIKAEKKPFPPFCVSVGSSLHFSWENERRRKEGKRVEFIMLRG